MTGARPRVYGECTSPQVSRELTGKAVLCLPVGSTEQHGPHLPLATDTIIAERFAAALADHVSGQHDLWLLPAIPFGLSAEHAWAPGTISLDTVTFTVLIRQLVGEYLRATSARRLVIVNGHGGNRGILEALQCELIANYGLVSCVIHPLALATAELSTGPFDIHAGIGETSLMLHLAPELVNMDTLAGHGGVTQQQAEAVNRLIRDRGVTWPWSSNDPDIAEAGIIGDPSGASASFGRAVFVSALEAAARAVTRLPTVSGAAPDAKGEP
jgi:creatinine amidohydrolase